ncbi:uncharacterized protein [Apostichopus japonicus]|uniref:uncharacterized protein isoform X1 n=1 Tax=Stichopus japonicus TaxID=307972 RepID=UPI003AB1C222
MHNKEAIMQLLISECEANIEIRDYSGRKPHHHLKSTASSFIKKLIKGGTPDPDERHPAKSLAEQRNKRQSKIGTFFKSQLRSSFRSVRIWGSADDLDSDRLKTRSLTPPKTPPTSPRMRSKSAQLEGFSKDNHLMPPPHPFQNRKSKKKAGRRSRSSPGSNVVARSESDSELMYDSPHTHIIMI